MSRVILNSNNSLVIIGESPSFKTVDETGVLFGGVNSSSFSCTLNREKATAVGHRGFQLNDINKHPDIDLDIDYIFSPLMKNEQLIGLGISTGLNYKPTGFLDELSDKSCNFYFYNHPDQGEDAIEYFKSADLLTPNSGEIYSFGNAYLTNYEVSLDIGSVPIVRTSYKCSNMQGDLYTGDIKSPAINLQSGNAKDVGNLVVSGTTLSGFDPISNQYFDMTDPDLHATSCGLVMNLDNLQIGGQKIDSINHRIENLSMSIPIRRVDLEGIGSDYVYGRKIKYPLEGSLSLQSKVSKYETGFISGLLAGEQDYNFSLLLKNLDNDYGSILRFKDVKLNDFSYSMDVNEDMSYSCSFLFSVNNKKEFNFWTTVFRDTVVYDSAGTEIRRTSADIPGEWSKNDLNAVTLEIGTAAGSINREAFSGCSNLSGTLTIPDFTDFIGRAAFKDCYNFNGSLYLHDLLPDVKRETFYNCSGFDGSLYLGESISSIGNSAFYNCTGLNGALVIPNTVASIGSEAFANCYGFDSSITISKASTTSLGANTFSGCDFNELILDRSTNVVNNQDFDYFSDLNVLITFADYTTGINDDAFDNYSFTGDLNLPLFLEKIGKRSFYNNTGLNGFLFINDEIKVIDNEAFYGCLNLTGNLLLPNSITGLGDYCFAGMEKLGPSFSFSTSLDKIQPGVFSGCAGFEGDLYLDQYIKSVGDAAFFDCSGLNGSLIIVGPKTLALNSFQNTNFNNLTLNKISSINDGDFDSIKNDSLSLVLGQDVKTIGDNAFDGYSFTGSLDTNNASLLGNNSFSGCSGFSEKLIIKDIVTGLGSGAFQDCNGFTGLYISKNLNEIKEKTFLNCSSFDGDLLIDQNIKNIKSEAFAGCSDFNSLTMEDGGVTGISSYAFADCTGLTSLYFASGLKYIGNNSFENCSSITGDLVIPENLDFLGEYAFSGCSSFDGQLRIPCGYTGLPLGLLSGATGFNSIAVGTGFDPLNAFSGFDFRNLTIKPCDNYKILNLADGSYNWYRPFSRPATSTITIEEGITGIPYRGMRPLSSITTPWFFTGKLTIPNSCRVVGRDAFQGSRYTSLDLGTGVERIGEDAFRVAFRTFYNAEGPLKIPSSCEFIDDDAFNGNDGFTELEFEEGIETINQNAFRSCSNITGNFVLPKSLKFIRDSVFNNAFSSSNNNKTFTLPRDNNLEQVGSAFFSTITSNKFQNVSDDIYLPKIRSIGNNAFHECTAFSGRRFYLNDQLQTMGSLAFEDCDLRDFDLEIPHDVFSVGSWCFKGNNFNSSLKVRPQRQPFTQIDGTVITTSSSNWFFNECNFNKLIVPKYVDHITGIPSGTLKDSYGYGFYDSRATNKWAISDNRYTVQSTLEFEEPSSLELIYDYAFQWHGYTGSLVIPASVKRIGYEAFDRCTGFDSIVIPKGSFEYDRFTGLLETTGTVAIDSGAFKKCLQAKRLECFPNEFFDERGLEPNSGSGYIHPLAFTGCKFKELSPSQGTTIISSGDYDYYWPYTDGGSTLDLSVGSLRTIDSYAFANKPITGDLNLGQFISDVREGAFSGCSSLSGTLTVLSANKIGTSAFKGTNFSSISLQNGILNTSDQTLNINEGDYIEFLGEATGLNLNESLVNLGNDCFSGFLFTDSLEIPKNVTGIGIKAFANCSAFYDDLKIGCSVASIGDGAFSGCGFSGSLSYGSSASIGNGVFDGSLFTGLIIDRCPNFLSAGSLDFYKDYGFDSNSTLKFKSNGVTGLGDYLFSGHRYSGILEMPDSLKYLGKGAFAGCTGFGGDLAIGSSVEYIGDECFLNCDSFVGVLKISGQNLQTIGRKAFSSLDQLSGNIVFPYTVLEVGSEAFDSCSGLGPVLDLGQDIEYIRSNAFRNCTGFSRLEGFNGNDNIGLVESQAFLNCSNITGNIVFGDGISGIGSSALQGCTSLNNVFLNVGSNKVGSNAFLSGPTGKLYVTQAFSGTYGTSYDGMQVALWKNYPSTIL